MGRIAGATPARGSFCTFVPDSPGEPRGRTSAFGCYSFGQSAPLAFEDVPTQELVGLL